MSAVSHSELILFIAALTVALGVATTLTTNVAEISSALDQRGSSVTTQVQTEVEIISDEGSPEAIYDDSEGNVTILVKNTGQQTLAADGSQLDVLVDGEFVAVAKAEVVGDPDATEWRPGEVLRVTVEKPLDPGDHRVKVHVNGDTDTIRFHTS